MKYIIIILLVFLSSCYTERKAREQFAKAAVAYPDIPAEYCATEFPVKDSLVTDTIYTTDTLESFDTLQVTDTVVSKDTVRIRITQTLPGKTITNTIRIKDTIFQRNTAAEKLCELERGKVINLLQAKTAEYDGMKKKRNIWMIIAICSLAVNALFIYLKIKK